MLFCAYQMTFAVITCALVGGATADRMKFSAFALFCVFWLFIVYVPSAHWVWGGGFLAQWGLIDFAGGTVVHINAGVAGLVAALMIGAAHRLPQGEFLALRPVHGLCRPRPAVGRLVRLQRRLGARRRLARGLRHCRDPSGRLRRRAGRGRASNGSHNGRPSVLGLISGAVAGLGTITPASGYVLPWQGAVIGVLAGGICYWASIALKAKLRL